MSERNEELELQLITTDSYKNDLFCLEDIIEYPIDKQKKKDHKKIVTYYLN